MSGDVINPSSGELYGWWGSWDEEDLEVDLVDVADWPEGEWTEVDAEVNDQREGK